jgi:hypothetical protein
VRGGSSLSANAGRHQERQRREVEETRRSFAEAGVGISAFEPAQLNGNGEGHGNPRPEAPTLAPSPAGRPRPTWASAAAIAIACLLGGGGLGSLLHRPAPSPEPVPAVITQTVVKTQTKPVVPGACLETARRGDEAIDLLLRNIRDRRLSSTVKAYTTASQACRREASP